MKLLLLATLFKLPYRVLRCAAAVPAEAYVLGGKGSRGLARSKYCRAFFDVDAPIDGAFNAKLALEVDRIADANGIDAVIAADARATRSLIAIRSQMATHCFPMPDLATFDLLNDKWRFWALCGELGLKRPQTELCLDIDDLTARLKRRAGPYPVLAKPLDRDGGQGRVRIDGLFNARTAARLNYSPLLLQEFIPGADASASLYCREGRVRAFVAQDYTAGVYSAYYDAGIYQDLARLAHHLGLNGIYNFDMRRTATGEVVFLECNPRVFFSMKMAMLAGVNFLRLGLCDEAAADPLFLERPVSVRFPRAMVAALAAPALFRKTAWPTLKFLLADPVPYMREKLGFEQERAHRRQADSYSDSTRLDPTRRSQLGGRNIQPVDALQNQRAGSAGA